MEKPKFNFINLLNISGSIASITGIAILIFEKSTENIDFGYLIAYLASAIIFIAFFSFILGSFLELYYRYLKPTDNLFKFGGVLLAGILACYIAVVIGYFIYYKITPIFVLLINHQYP